jgi:general secretion pathway protein F
MPVFEYVALNTAGKRLKGTLEADSIRTARQRLRAQNIFPTDIKESAEASKAKSKDVKRLLGSDRVKLKDLTLATRLLATLSNAGLPLVAALLALADQLDHQGLKRIVVDIKERVEQGSSLAKALAAYPKVFPRLYVNMVASGEASGTLDTVLENLADYYEAQLELRRKVMGALTYPAVMFSFCILVVLLLVAFVVPGIVEIFVKQKLTLPLPTRIVIAFSDIVIGYWWAMALAVMGTVAGVRQYYATEQGRERIDRLLLKLPVFGGIYRKVSTARVASTLATLLGGGVELLGALDIVKNIVGNVHMRRALEEARDGVREGRNLSKELSKSGFFPPLLCQMVGIGEKSGKLESMLMKAGKTFTGEANAAISGLTSLLEPFLIIFLGLVVLVIVVSILLPASQLMSMMGPA